MGLIAEKTLPGHLYHTERIPSQQNFQYLHAGQIKSMIMPQIGMLLLGDRGTL